MRRFMVGERSFWLAAAGVFALLVGLNYLPMFVGKIPFPKEIVLGFPPWQDISTVDAPQSYSDIGDLVTSFYPFRALASEAMREGTLPLWNPYILSGAPFLANAQSALFYPPNFLYYLFSLPVAWALSFLLRMFLSALFTALLVRSIGGTHTGAILSGIIFASCGFMTVWQGQPMSDAAMWLPFICYAVDRLHKNRSKRSTALVAVAFAMPVLAGHPETALHVTFTGLALAFFLWAVSARRDIRTSNWQFAGWFVVAGLLAGGLASVQIVPTMEWVGWLGRHLSMTWPALPTNEAIGLFSRDILRSPNSAGIRMPEGTAYLGMMTCLLASLSPFHAARRHIAFFAVLTLSALAIAYSVEPMYWLASHTPIIGTLKNGRLILIASLGIAVLAGLGVSALEEQAAALVGRKRAIALVLLSAAFLLSFFLVYKLQHATGIKVEFMRRPSFSRALLFASIIPILWKLFGGLRGFRFPVMILAVAMFDFVTFSYGAVGFARPDQIFPSAPLFDFLKTVDNRSTFRVVQVDNPYPVNSPMMYGVATADGYEVSLERTLGFWSGLSENRMDGVTLSSHRILQAKDRRLDMLNVKYIVTYVNGSKALRKSPRFSSVFNNGSIEVFENKSVLPRGFTVPASGIEVVPDLQGQLARLQDSSFNPRESVITSEEPPRGWVRENNEVEDWPLKSTKSHVEMTDGRTQEVAFRTQTFEPTIFVLSQTYYPGWTATVDGIDTRVFPANLALTGISLPAGSHDVRFAFRPASVKLGMEFSAISVVILFGLVIGGIQPATMRKYYLAPSPRFVAGASVVLFVPLLLAIASVNLFDLERVIGPGLAHAPDLVSHDDHRMQQLRPFLPRSGEIGYLSDDPADDEMTNSESDRKLRLTQYALVPLVVRPGVDNEFVVGNFSSAASAAIHRTGLAVVKDFGNGLMLLRRKRH